MRSPHKRYVLKPLHLAVVVMLGGLAYLAPVNAADVPVASRQTYAIPAGELNGMLLSIARQSGRAISFDPGLVAAYRGTEVKGSLTVEQAIAACLYGTNFALDVTSNGTLTVQPAPAPVAISPTNVTANDAQLPEISVLGAMLSEDQLYYNPSNSSVVSRTDAPLKETAQSVEVLSGKLIQDRQASDLAQVLESSAGVQQTIGARGSPQYTIRGFNVQQTATNGISNPGISSTPVQGIERVEVLKGPDSIMSGSSTPGGTINIVRKAPVTEDLHALTLEVAKNGEFKQGLDLGGALTDDKSLSYRLNLSNKKSDKVEPDFDGQQEVFVAPALTWRDDTTQLTIGAEISNTRNPAPRATVALNGAIQHIPSERIFRKDDGFRSKNKSGYYEFEHSLNDKWSINSKATFIDARDRVHLWQLQGLNADGSIGFATPYAAEINSRSWSTQNDIRGKIETGWLTQHLLVGVDYQHIEALQYERSVPGEGGAFPNVSIYDPNSFDELPKFGGPNYKSSQSRLQQRGLILQDQIDLGDRVHVLLAAKKAKWISDSKAYQDDGALFNASSTDAEKWVPNYGISFDLTKQITIYANLLHGFTGSASLNAVTGAALPPQTSKSKEVGVKLSLLDDNLTLTSAYFELQEDNIPVADPITQDIIGNQSRFSKGYDINLSGSLVPGWNVSASYTHVKFDDPGASGDQLSLFSGEPENSASLWTSYEIQEGAYKGFGGGIGVDAFGKTTGGSSFDDYPVPGGASTDLSVFYHGSQYSFTLGVRNLFDRELYYSSTSSSFVPLRDERNARLTVTYNF